MKLKTKALVGSALISFLFIMLMPFTWGDLTQFLLWQKIDLIFFNKYPHLSFFRSIHLLISTFWIFFGSYHCVQIVVFNKQVHPVRNNLSRILREGYYGRVRHPMYSMFLIIFTSLSFALCSSFSIILGTSIVGVLILFVVCEEKYMLLPRFKDDYTKYQKEVPKRLVMYWQWIYLSTMLAVTITGIFF